MACGCKKRREKMQQMFSDAAVRIRNMRGNRTNYRTIGRKPRKSVGIGG